MPAKMTSTAWNQGAKNALVVGPAMLVVWFTVTAAVVLIFGQPVFLTLGRAAGALGVLAVLAFFFAWLNGRNAAGRILLDCGRHPAHGLFLMEAVLFAALALGIGAHAISIGQESGWDAYVRGTGWPAIAIMFVPYWLVMASGRLQARENGLWEYWGLLRWNKIGSYRWTDDGTLLIRRERRIFPWITGAIPVPPEQKLAVDELLTKFCPTAAKG